MLSDSEAAARLEDAAGEDKSSWLSGPEVEGRIRQAAEAAGLPLSTVVRSGGAGLSNDGLVGVAAAALYTVRDVFGFNLRDTLLRWSRQPKLDTTALAAVYGLTPSPQDASGRSAASRSGWTRR